MKRFAAQALAVTRDLGLPDDAAHVNPNGGAVRWATRWAPPAACPAGDDRGLSAETDRRRYALCTMCIGVGQDRPDY